MALTGEQIKELKKQLSDQIKDLPTEQRAEAQKQIDSMSPKALETMLSQQQQQTKIFRKIANKEIPSKIITENNEALAILEIRPISPGHVIIVSKKAITDTKKTPPSIIEFSKLVAEKLTKSLGCKKVEIRSAIQFGEVIINLIPIYDKGLDLDSPRKETSDSDLEIMKNKILSYKPPVQPVKKARKPRIQRRKIARRIP